MAGTRRHIRVHGCPSHVVPSLGGWGSGAGEGDAPGAEGPEEEAAEPHRADVHQAGLFVPNEPQRPAATPRALRRALIEAGAHPGTAATALTPDQWHGMVMRLAGGS